jgi:hypothetical protein
MFKNSARTAKKTPHFTITKINWLTLFKEIIAVYSENHMKSTNTLCWQNAEWLRFQVLTAASMKMTVFGDIAPCSLVDVHRRFRSVYCLHHHGDEQLIALMMEAVSSSETQINLYQAERRNIPEDSHLHILLAVFFQAHIVNVCSIWKQ